MLTLFIRRSATAIVLTTVVFVLDAGCSDTVGSGFSSDDDSDFDFRELPAVQQDYLRFKEAEDRRKDDVGDGLDMRADDPMKWGTGNLCQKGRIEVESRNEGATGKAKMFFSQRPARRKTVFGLGDGSQTLQHHYLDSESHYAQYSSQGEPEPPTFNLIIRHPTVDLRFSGARDDLLERLPTGEVDSADTFMEKRGTAYEWEWDPEGLPATRRAVAGGVSKPQGTDLVQSS